MAQGTRNLVAAAEDAGVRRFVLASALGLDERSKDAVPYFAAKWEMERAVKDVRPRARDLPAELRLRQRRRRAADVRAARALRAGDADRRAGDAAPAADLGRGRRRVLRACGRPSRPRRTARSSSAARTRSTWNEFWDRLKRVLGVRRPSMHVPFGVMRLQAALTERLPGAPVTRDQLTMLELGDNVVTDPTRSRRSSCRSSRSTSSCAARRRDARPRLRGAGTRPAVEEITARPARGRTRCRCASRPAASATPTCTSSRPAAGGCRSRSCSATRAPVSSRRSAPT